MNSLYLLVGIAIVLALGVGLCVVLVVGSEWVEGRYQAWRTRRYLRSLDKENRHD